MDAQRFPCLNSRRLVGDPVDVVTGANTDINVDFRLRGPLPLRWRRHYNSTRNGVACALGWGQTHGYDRTLTYDLEGLRYTGPSGDEVPFPSVAVGEGAVNAGFLLRRVSSEHYDVLQAGEPVHEFEFNRSSEIALLRRLRRGEARIEFQYDANGRLAAIFDSLGRWITIESGRDGRIVNLFLSSASAAGGRRELMAYRYDTAGNLVRGRDLHDGLLGFQWDQHNRMTCRTDRSGYSFHFEYDEEGHCIHSRGDDGLLEVFLEFQPLQNTTTVRRGDGGKWTYLYDKAGTVTKIIDPYGGATAFTIDEAGRVTEEIDPNGNVTQHLYNSMGGHYARLHPLGYMLPTHEEDPNPPDPLAYKLPETALEWEHGRVLRLADFRTLNPGDPILKDIPTPVLDLVLGTSIGTTTNQSGLRPTAVEGPPREDEQGRPTEQGRPGQIQYWKYDANGNVAEHQDRDGAVYRYVYKLWNATHEEIDPLGRTTIFQHSSQGLVSSVQDPGGTLTEYGYDLKDRIAEVRQHGRVLERYHYDPAGNMVGKTDGEGSVLVKWKVGKANLDATRLLSDGETHLFEYDDRGRIVAAATTDHTASFEFDEAGRRRADKRDRIGVTHEFDLGQLTSTTYFDKFDVSYRNDGDRLVITDPTGGSHHIRNSEGGLLLKHLANGARELCWYDSLGRCRGKSLLKNRQRQPSWTRTFTYSPVGDLLCVKDTLAGSVRYSYDKAHDLAEETLPDQTRRTFRFDNAGNLLHQPGLSSVEMDLGNRLRAANGDRFTYDGRDRLSTREGPGGTTRYEYNALDMLVRCEMNGESWTASYDTLCRRIRKTWHGQTTEYYWDDFRLAAETRQDGSVRLYVYEDESALVPFMFVEYAGMDSAVESGHRFYIFTNQIGVPVRVEDDAGKACWSARIDPYGLAHVSPDSSLEMSLRFPGHYHDPETGLHYNRFRYFSPELGRYLQSDPAGQEGGINLYAYPANPLTEADIDGLAKTGPAPKKPRASGGKGKGTPKGKNAACPAGQGRTATQPTGKDPAVKVGDVGKYKDLVARGRVGDKLTPDHIPSAAALIKAEEKRRREAGITRPLTTAEKNAIRNNGNCVVVPHDLHVAGETYGGKNNKDQIAADAESKKSMAAAEKRDLDAHKKNAEDHDVDPAVMDKAAKDLKNANKNDGVTS